MVTLIQAATRLEAWMRGTEHLLDHDSALNLVLEITFPTHGPNDHAATARIDDFLAAEGQMPTYSVAETIFPGSEYKRRGLRGVFETYPQQVYPSIKKHPSCTYAHRLLRRKRADGQQINPQRASADALGTLIAGLTWPDVNLSPAPVNNAHGPVRQAGLDQHGTGPIFEELVRRFNAGTNQEAGKYRMPRDAMRLMVGLLFPLVAEEIPLGTNLLYDGACASGSMLAVAHEQQLAPQHGNGCLDAPPLAPEQQRDRACGDAEYSLVTRSRNSSTSSLANKLSKMKQTIPVGRSASPRSTRGACSSRYSDE